MEYNFEGSKICLENAFASKDVFVSVDKIITMYENILPKNKKALILLKPNLNNDLNALTGNSTDLRLIVAVVKVLQQRGYSKILIGEGSNCGTAHAKLDILERLGVRRLCGLLGVKCTDLNKGPYKYIYLTHKKKTRVSAMFDKADFVINLPKIKTHIEATMTLSSKNLMGGLQGVHKRNIHSNFFPNIVALNKWIKPDLHIVDGLVAMEGDGPGNGVPVKMGVLVAGTNNYVVDAFCAKISGFDPLDLPYLRLAVKKGFLGSKDVRDIRNKVKLVRKLKKPGDYLLAKLLLNNIFVLPRYWKIFDWIFNIKFVGTLLYRLNIRQDIYTDKLPKISFFWYEHGDEGKICEEFCPLGLTFDKNKDLKKTDCIECMYCLMACSKSIKLQGDLGFFEGNYKRYRKYRKNLLK